MNAVEERRWPPWKICYFLFFGVLLAVMIALAVEVVVLLINGADSFFGFP